MGLYQYDFDSNINSNWTIQITLLSIKSIRNFPISDFDPFDFVEIVGGDGATIPEYESVGGGGYCNNNLSEYEREYKQELREFDQKRLNEELIIMRKEYTMFYEDIYNKKQKKSKQKMRQKQKPKKKKKEEKMVNVEVDVIHDDEDDDDGNYDEYDSKEDSEYIEATMDGTSTDSTQSGSQSETESQSDSDYTTESDIYGGSKREVRYDNDYDHILMYSNRKRINKNKKKKQYLCAAIMIILCILVWILTKHVLV